jgi:hypothetical protein
MVWLAGPRFLVITHYQRLQHIAGHRMAHGRIEVGRELAPELEANGQPITGTGGVTGWTSLMRPLPRRRWTGFEKKSASGRARARARSRLHEAACRIGVSRSSSTDLRAAMRERLLCGSSSGDEEGLAAPRRSTRTR